MTTSNQFQLLKQRRFLPFFITQACGALNDNIFKNAVLITIAFKGVEMMGLSSGMLVNAASILFILPFFLFSATFGQLADKYEKSKSIQAIKILEILIMLFAVAALIVDSIVLMISVLFLLGVQSTAFGPIKYGILPQHLKREELTSGNGLVEMGTFLAILLGTLLGGVLVSLQSNSVAFLSLALIFVAIAGYLASRKIPISPPAAPDLKINWNPISQTIKTFRYMTESRTVWQSILGISWFWFYGAVFLAQIPTYTMTTLGGDQTVTTLILMAFSVGIGTGAMLCNKLSRGRIEPGIVPLGAFGISVFTIHLFYGNQNSNLEPVLGAVAFLQHAGNIRILLDIVLIGVFGGIFTVPLYAMVQHQAEPARLSRIIAGGNIVNALFMVISGIYAIILLSLGVTIPQLFLITALLNVVIALYIFKQVPEFISRLIIWLAINLLYRVRGENLSNIPDEGACVLVANHVSFVDALLIAGCCKRNMRFVMYHKIFDAPFIGGFFRMVNAIPIAPAKEDAQLMNKAFDEIHNALAKGHMVCIFPEGKLTADGEVDYFRSGIEKIVTRSHVPVIPLALKGLWQTWFSRRKGHAMKGLPGYFRGKIELIAGELVAAENVTASGLEVMIKDMRGSTQ